MTGFNPESFPIQGGVGGGPFSGGLPGQRRLSGAIPRAAVGFLAQLLRDAGVVVQVEARTGILTSALWRARCHLLVSDSNPANVAHLRRSLPSVPVVRSEPANLALRSAFAGAAIVDSGFRFAGDSEPGREIRRIVRSGGVLVRVATEDSENCDGFDLGDGPAEERAFVEDPQSRQTLVRAWRL